VCRAANPSFKPIQAGFTDDPGCFPTFDVEAQMHQSGRA
jgi:hypothetical protein